MRWRCEIPAISFAGDAVLHSQTVEFGTGVTSVLGVNGAGKSTLFSSILGISHPAPSLLEVDGRVIPSSDRSTFMATIGHLPQEVPAPWTMRANELVTYAGWLKGLQVTEARRRADEVLGWANLTDASRKAMPALSGGMRRRVGIAAAVVHRPRVVVLDEPTAGLDPVERRRVHDLIAELSTDGIVVVATHLLEDVRACGGQVAILNQGQLSNVGPVDGGPCDDELLELMRPEP